MRRIVFLDIHFIDLGLLNTDKLRTATINRSGFRVASRIRLIILAGLWLITVSAYAQNSEGDKTSHFRNQLNQAAPFAFYGLGARLSGVAKNSADLANFNNNLLNFQEVATLNSTDAASGPAGQLGPLFNNTSCLACHSNPARGGGPNAHRAKAVNRRTAGITT
jgi:hypothetical protein